MQHTKFFQCFSLIAMFLAVPATLQRTTLWIVAQSFRSWKLARDDDLFNQKMETYGLERSGIIYAGNVYFRTGNVLSGRSERNAIVHFLLSIVYWWFARHASIKVYHGSFT